MEHWQLIDWLVELEETQGHSSWITDTNESREPNNKEQIKSHRDSCKEVQGSQKEVWQVEQNKTITHRG